MVYMDFGSFMRECVLPSKKHPDDIRLDGELTGGKRRAFGYFRHNEREWKVDEDTRYLPLLLALEAFERDEDPFVESVTSSGKGTCLSLNAQLAKRQKSRHKYLYIYAH